MRYISYYIVTWLIKHKAILNEDRELYEYAVYGFFLTTFPIIISITIGGIMGKIFESILFIVTFMLTRKYSGGFHTRHACVCIISSLIILFVCIYIIANIKYNFIFDIGIPVSIRSSYFSFINCFFIRCTVEIPIFCSLAIFLTLYPFLNRRIVSLYSSFFFSSVLILPVLLPSLPPLAI